MIDAASTAVRQSVSAPSADITRRRTVSFADGQRIKDEAYRAMVEEMQNAWRTRNGIRSTAEAIPVTTFSFSSFSPAYRRWMCW